ncbi:hypothetical protein E3N88_12911 [Mikania micrantha]|uniref:Uncharacterized protein n=1 Tax=Mikania micrantha TaxID=192012 RepID=A0A5N6P8N9_9ASTR|nr:hypothetical protein E3N88_12911 [Mikania micrantha]
MDDRLKGWKLGSWNGGTRQKEKDKKRDKYPSSSIDNLKSVNHFIPDHRPSDSDYSISRLAGRPGLRLLRHGTHSPGNRRAGRTPQSSPVITSELSTSGIVLI